MISKTKQQLAGSLSNAHTAATAAGKAALESARARVLAVQARIEKASAAAAARQAEIDATDPVLLRIAAAARVVASNRRTSC